MTPEQILRMPARVLTNEQREYYFARGYILLESLIPGDVIVGLNELTQRYLERSRELRNSSGMFDLAQGHSAGSPKLRRLVDPDLDPGYWEFATGVIADVAADLLGPDVVFHHSKLNFKWRTDAESNAVGWHQDIPFYPHTNYNVLAIGTYLADTKGEDGPMMVIPGSHNGPLYELYDTSGNWTGEIGPADARILNAQQAVSLPGPRGSVTVHHARTVHGSLPGNSCNLRPLLINAYSAADAFPYTDGGTTSVNYRKIVRGKKALWSCHDPRPCPMPPDWSAGYPSIYEQQHKAL